MPRTRINSPQIDLIQSTDANGWTLYDYGDFKQYRKRVTYSQAFTNGTSAVLSVSSTNLPVGMSTISTNKLDMNVVGSSWAMDINIRPEMSTSSSALTFVGRAFSSQTFNGFIDVTITTP